jgi:hypothetical protein
MRLVDRGADDAAALSPAETALPACHRTRLDQRASRRRLLLSQRGIGALESPSRHDDAIFAWERAAGVNPNDATSLGRLQLAYESATDADRRRARASHARIRAGRLGSRA